jgi:hypothetical protein
MKTPHTTKGLTKESRAGLRAGMKPVDEMTEALNMAGADAGSEAVEPPEVEADPEAPQSMTPEIEARLTRQYDINNKAKDLADAMAAQQFEAARVIGQMQTLEAFRALSAAGNIKLFQQMKEAKQYKGLRVPQPDGSILTVNTFEEFCELMGTSRRKVEEDLQNLKFFGESFMETSKRAGLGYRDLRMLRAMPEDERQLVIEGEKVDNDPEALKELLEDLASRNATLKAELKEKDKELATKDEVAREAREQRDKAQEKLIKLSKLTPDERVLERRKAEHAALKDLHAAGATLLGCFTKYLAIAQSLLDMDDISSGTADTIMHHTSALFNEISTDTLNAGIDVDFRILTYPLELGDIALRGDDSTADAE